MSAGRWASKAAFGIHDRLHPLFFLEKIASSSPFYRTTNAVIPGRRSSMGSIGFALTSNVRTSKSPVVFVAFQVANEAIALPWKNIGHLSGDRGDQHNLAHVSLHFLYRTFRLVNQRLGGRLVLLFRTTHRHIIPRLSRRRLGRRRQELRFRFIPFLGSDHPFFEKALHPVVRFLSDIHAYLRLLPYLVGSAYHLVPRALSCFTILRKGSVLGCRGLCQLGMNFGTIYMYQRIALLHPLPLFHEEPLDPSRQLAGNPYFGGLSIPLNNDGLGFVNDPPDDEKNDDNRDQSRERYL